MVSPSTLMDVDPPTVDLGRVSQAATLTPSLAEKAARPQVIRERDR
jgi:hypothetical protein